MCMFLCKCMYGACMYVVHMYRFVYVYIHSFVNLQAKKLLTEYLDFSEVFERMGLDKLGNKVRK